jgi:hypothetical protein
MWYPIMTVSPTNCLICGFNSKSNRIIDFHVISSMPVSSVPTEEYVRRFQRQSAPYRMNDLKDVDWSKEPDWLKSAFYPAKNPQGLPSSRQPKTHTQETMDGVLARRMLPELDQILDFGLLYHAEDEVSLVFHYLLLLPAFPAGDGCQVDR